MTTRVPTHSPTPSTPAPTIPTLGDDPFAVGALVFALLLFFCEFVRVISFNVMCCGREYAGALSTTNTKPLKNPIATFYTTWSFIVFMIDHVWLALAWGLFAGSYINDLLSNGSYLTNTASTTGQADLATVIIASFGSVSIILWWVYYAMVWCGGPKTMKWRESWAFGFGINVGVSNAKAKVGGDNDEVSEI